MAVVPIKSILFLFDNAFQIPPRFASLMQAHLQCQSSSGVSPALLGGISSGNIPDDPSVRRHLLCINQRLGIQDSSGNLQMDTISQMANTMAPPGVDRITIQQVVSRCAIQRSNSEDTAFQMDRCLLQSGTSMIG